MKLIKIISYVIIISSFSSIAQDDNWTSEFSDEGNVKVVYRIYDSLMVNGEEEKFIEYSATTKTSA